MEYENTITKYKVLRGPFETVKKAVNDLVEFIKPTFGPGQNKILINNEVQSIMLDDGVKIAEQFGSENDFENAVITFIKATAQKTNKRVGDGTTGSLILLQAIINQVPELYNSLSIITELKKGLAEAKEKLLSSTVKIETQDELQKVAEVSCNDPKIAAIIAELMFAVGQDGTIAIQEGSELEITKELTEGMQFERGAVSRYMFPNKKMETTLDFPKIFVFGRKLDMKTAMPLVEKISRLPENQRDALFIAEDYDQDLANFLGRLRMTGVLNIVAVKSPAFGAENKDQAEDIAVLCRTEVINDQRNIGEVELSEAGSATKVTVTEGSTLILGGAGDVSERVAQLKAIKNESKFDDQKIQERIGRLTGKVAVIKVGGLTDEEAIATYEKVEDAVNATRVAFRGGVVRGAGVELNNIETSSKILNKALKAPANTLIENLGIMSINGNYAVDIVQDPTEVLIAALESAVSIASLLIAGKGILLTYQDKR